MGKRFQQLSGKYKKLGKLELATRLEAEATIQLDAWRKAKEELKRAS